MTNDRELLELAAKAAGLELDPFSYTDRADLAQNSFTAKNYVGRWNPLTDDGDALRLAVKLGMDVLIQPTIDSVGNTTVYGPIGAGPDIRYVELHSNGDHYAATRRAIVCVAAEIGKGRK
jgi:hypothetical protein